MPKNIKCFKSVHNSIVVLNFYIDIDRFVYIGCTNMDKFLFSNLMI